MKLKFTLRPAMQKNVVTWFLVGTVVGAAACNVATRVSVRMRIRRLHEDVEDLWQAWKETEDAIR